jgi:hypothetical protein
MGSSLSDTIKGFAGSRFKSLLKSLSKLKDLFFFLRNRAFLKKQTWKEVHK